MVISGRADDGNVVTHDERQEIVRKYPLAETLSDPCQWHANVVGYGTIRHHRSWRIAICVSDIGGARPATNHSTPLGRCISNAYRIGPYVDLACRFMNILNPGWPRSSSPQHEGKAIWSRTLVLPGSFISHRFAFRVCRRFFGRHHRRRTCSYISSSSSLPFVIFHPLSTESPSLPALSRCHFLALASFILFTHVHAYICRIFFPLPHRRFISANVTAAGERAIRRSLVQKRGGTIYSVICRLAHCRNCAV